jgi:hypothetical protein
MNTPRLLASFAVASVASAADLKDPADVAREWRESTVEPPVLSAGAGLNEGPTKPFVAGRVAPSIRFRGTPQGPNWGPVPGDRIYDAPNYSVPPVLPDNLPPGTKLWRYGGGTYYLMPLVPAREK